MSERQEKTIESPEFCQVTLRTVSECMDMAARAMIVLMHQIPPRHRVSWIRYEKITGWTHVMDGDLGRFIAEIYPEDREVSNT